MLEENLDLNIPGQLLHLLDGIGSRLELGGSENATTIRNNIALLVSDAVPEMPVKGLRIAARDNDSFYEGAFEILRGKASFCICYLLSYSTTFKQRSCFKLRKF